MFDPPICAGVSRGSALARGKAQGVVDGAPDLLGADARVERLPHGPSAQLPHHVLVGPDLVVAGAERLLHPSPELGVPHAAPPLREPSSLTSATTYPGAGGPPAGHPLRAPRDRRPTPPRPRSASPSSARGTAPPRGRAACTPPPIAASRGRP